MSQEIYNKVATIIADQFNTSIEDLTLSTRFKEDLKADSIAVVELIMAFEDAFGETIDDELAQSMATIGDIVKLIEERQA